MSNLPSMSFFPIDGLVGCLMSLAIYHTKVEYLALSLFNVRVESAGQVRYAVLNEGAELLPSPEMTLTQTVSLTCGALTTTIRTDPSSR